jgi:hypothetical protein
VSKSQSNGMHSNNSDNTKVIVSITCVTWKCSYAGGAIAHALTPGVTSRFLGECEATDRLLVMLGLLVQS